MNINDVDNFINLRSSVLNELKKLKVKFTLRKTPKQELKSCDSFVFNKTLSSLSSHEITLSNGLLVKVPKVLHSMCSFILTRAETEGIFRKAGSVPRQKQLKKLLEAGDELQDSHHVIDVACVLKTFLRELPEPVIPTSHHELFLKCVTTKDFAIENLQLACLLLPTEHIYALAYMAEFLQNVAAFKKSNKMNIQNLSIIFLPVLMPFGNSANTQTVQQRVQVLEALVENATVIGLIPDRLDMSALSAEQRVRRRSGSISRMLSGIKKMVAGNKIADVEARNCPLTRSASKRRSVSTPDLVDGTDDIAGKRPRMSASHSEIAERRYSDLTMIEERVAGIEEGMEELRARCQIDTPPRLSPSADQVARRLSRELRIRPGPEVHRSPSARRIGSVRRRSAELSHSLRRGRPNTVRSGLPTPVTRAASFHQQGNGATPPVCWINADSFFARAISTPTLDPASQENLHHPRASINVLRQYKGTVLARARLFDDVVTSRNSIGKENTGDDSVGTRTAAVLPRLKNPMPNRDADGFSTPMPKIKKPLTLHSTTPASATKLHTLSYQRATPLSSRIPLKALQQLDDTFE